MEPEESLPAVLRGEADVAVAHEYDLLPRPLDPLFERRELLDDPARRPRRPGRAVRRRLLRGRYAEQGADSVGDRGGHRRHRQLAEGSSRDVTSGHQADRGPEGERRDPADDHRGDHRG
jgi:hypothetical protein